MNPSVHYCFFWDGRRNSTILIPRGPGPFFTPQIPEECIITPRLLEVLTKYPEDLKNWKISSFLRVHNLVKFTSWDFFHFSNGDNQNVSENLRFHGEFLEIV